MEQESSNAVPVKPTLEEIEKRIKEEDAKRKDFDKEYTLLLAERDRLRRAKAIQGFFDRVLACLGLCRKSERDSILIRLTKLEEERKNEKTHHAAELKRLRMNMSSIEQQREGLKDIAANWKEIQARWEDYEKFVGPEQLAKLKKGK